MPEVRYRSALHRNGLRFRKDFPIRLSQRRPVRPDIVFTRARVAVFIDGCFWHGCADHQRVPRTNRDYWIPKLARNVARDREVDEALTAAGWLVLRIWEHEDPVTSADDIASEVRARSGTSARQSALVAPGPASLAG